MIITGRTLLGGEGGAGNSGSITSVKTDGTTITGDGNTAPLTLGPGEKNSVGGYVLAYRYGSNGTDYYGSLIAGDGLTPAGVNPGNSANPPMSTVTLPGTWRLCCEAFSNTPTVGLYQRVK